MSLRDHPFRIYYGPADDPLANFYIPALSASVRYDRSAGFFSSSALAVAAAGVARLIQNGGRMRLLVGASLDEGDVEAIRKGHDLQERVTTRLLERFPDPQDALLRERLEVLAWMVAEGTLEIRVVLPRDAHGLPIPASQSQDYYHPKSGIFTDANGDRVAFTGSVNESATAWSKNYESFLRATFPGMPQKPTLTQVAAKFRAALAGTGTRLDRPRHPGRRPRSTACLPPARARRNAILWSIRLRHRSQRSSARATSAAIHKPNASFSSSSAMLPTCRVRSGWERPRPPSHPGRIRRASPMSSWPISPAGPCCAMRSAWARPSKPAW